MARTITLGLCVIASALMVMYSTYRSRLLVEEVHSMNSEIQEYDTYYGRLELEQQTCANHDDVQATARSRLGMLTPAAQQRIPLSRLSGGAQ